VTDKRGFASDNQAGVHEEVLQAIQDANHGHVPSYGGDHYTAATKERFREHFGDDVEVYFVFNGTAANVLAASAVCRPYDAVISCRTSHFTIDECGATERFTGCRVLTVEARGGKMEVGVIEPFLQGAGDAHRSQARMISITQASELGTVYSPAEIQVLADYAHDHDMYLHMDGSRLANAAAGLDMDLRQVTADVDVDLLSFGGTKNGLLLGEAVVFFDPELARNFAYVHKQGMQLASKMRFVSVQFQALLTDDLWLRSARHANAMAQLLASKVREIAGVEIVHPVEANAVFARLPPECIPGLQAQYFFHPMDMKEGIVRWMPAFDTTEGDVVGFVAAIEKAVSGR
jgi:threonine aldolase